MFKNRKILVGVFFGLSVNLCAASGDADAQGAGKYARSRSSSVGSEEDLIRKGYPALSTAADSYEILPPTGEDATHSPAWFVYLDQLYRKKIKSGLLSESSVVSVPDLSSLGPIINGAFMGGLRIFQAQHPRVQIKSFVYKK